MGRYSGGLSGEGPPATRRTNLTVDQPKGDGGGGGAPRGGRTVPPAGGPRPERKVTHTRPTFYWSLPPHRLPGPLESPEAPHPRVWYPNERLETRTVGVPRYNTPVGSRTA